jgi:hypothetical protein
MLNATLPAPFLSNDRLMSLAPSVFATAAHTSRSDRYSYIPTIDVVNGLASEGFHPVQVKVSRVRDDGRKGFEKHMIKFRHVDTLASSADGVVPEVALVNSHDGTTAYKLLAGLFRMLCCNGLIVPESPGSVSEVHIRHTGENIVRDVIAGSFGVLGESQRAIETSGRWSQLQLTDGEQTALAIGAHHARFADAEGHLNTPVTPDQLLRARRSDDRKNDLWTTFNRIQENTIKGGLRATATDRTGRRRRITTREVKGIDGNLNLNKALWKMAEHLASLKAS